MPGWLRKFLNLDDELPSYEPSSAYSAEPPAPQPLSFAPAARPASSYSPPALPPAAYGQAPEAEQTGASRFAPNYPGTESAEEKVKRFSSFTSAPPSAASPVGESGVRPAGPPPLAPRPAPSNGPISTGPISEAAANGFVQPIGFAVRSFARGALPPQGIEQFSREFRATMTDVWNFYTYWIRFETEDLLNMGREAADALTGMLPPMGETVAPSSQPRRIKVSQGSNGEGEAKRPAPPAPTAVFSPTVKADDAVVPPAGKDTSTEFASRMAKETAPVAKDVAETTRKAAEGLKADVAALGSAATSATPSAPPAPSAATTPATPPATPPSAATPSAATPPAKPGTTPSAPAATPPAKPGTTPSASAGDPSKDKKDKK
jgi:hypothetical protein